ncbi:P-loop containing nucleoside triphosphate hydrolase [Phytophthora cactorum]|nr:P-loop containing nucleoside triphosphate hydrolase [Phytophthora cactorum]
MLSSVNPKDFEMEMLEAQEFDDDFVLFLRKEIFGTDKKHEADGVKVMSLFGKQKAVKHELQRNDCWSDEMENNLKTEDQGIYCVAKKSDCTVLLLFGWIPDDLFCKSRLRDTATYVLRFLTCLSPDMVCCVSSEDVKLLDRAVSSMNSNNLDAWRSFSVAFHVERQEEQRDGVLCEQLGTFLLPMNSSPQNLQLLKGSYPAYSVVKPAPATKCKESRTQRFDNVSEFASWLINESKQRNLRLDFGIMGPDHFRNVLLKTTGRWPEKELKVVKDMLDRSLQTSVEQSMDRVQTYIEEHRATLLRYMESLFDLDVLYKGAKDEPAFVTLNKYVQEVQSDRSIWSKLGTSTQVTLNLPLRLKNQMKAIASTFRDGLANGSDKDVAESLAVFIREFTVLDTKIETDNDGFFGRVWKKVWPRDQESEFLSDKFRECMAEPLNAARQAWFQSIETALAIADGVLLKRWSEETQQSLRKSCQADEHKLSRALTNLLHLACQHERAHDDIPRNDNGDFSSVELGTHRLNPGAAILKAFTIKNHCIVLVTTSPKGTLVERVDFPLQRSWWGEKIGKRLLKKVVGWCSTGSMKHSRPGNLQAARIVATNVVDTPSRSVLLVDGSLYATDTSGSIQSVNLKNQQTSRAVQIMPRGLDSAENSECVELFAVASEDFRKFRELFWKRGTPFEGFVLNEKRKKICVCRLAVTVRSESLRIQHSKEHSVNGSKTESDGLEGDENHHWLRAFYHTYEKFPPTKESCRYFFQVMMRDLRKLNKPLGGMDFARDLAFSTESNAGRDNVAALPLRQTRYGHDEWKATPMDTQSQNLQAVDIALVARRCIVITSMGKQSTGKSYLLNHLTGSSFAIAGARCTDGAWMSIRILPKNVLLVFLTLRSRVFRTNGARRRFPVVLNASISMFTIFRMEMRFDKEIDDLFARFQKGVALIKGDPSLFRGKLYMSVKDVNPNDQKGVLDEFLAKFQKLVGANKDNNFLLDLYSGQLDINCSPPLGTTNYYQSLMHAQNFIETSLCGVDTAGFRSGKAFLNCIRLVLAKIAILDWTSLDEGAKQFQLSEISSKLPGLLRTDVVVAGNGKVIDVDLVTMSAEYPALGEKWKSLNAVIDLDSLPDWEIDLGFDCCSSSDDTIVHAHGAIKQLFRLFLRSNTSIQGGKMSREIVTDFDAFLAFFVRRRKARISAWVKQMLGGRVPEEWKAMEQQFLGRFQMLLTRCQSKCDDCRLGCMKAAAHPGTTNHDCGGNHICAGRCEYCESSEQFGKTPSCAKESGHEGKCECSDGDHTCGQECCMANSPNCGKKCSLKRGHSDLHKCDVPIHTCGEECSAQSCSGRCVLNVEDPHTAHKCVEVRCMQKCVIDGCNEVCGTMDHFHGQVNVAVVFSVENDEKGAATFDAASEAPVVHMCGNGHECQALCEEKGVCRVDVFLKQSSKTFTGARGSFQFTFQEMNGSRKKCTKLLPPGQKMHQGSHTCICEQRDEDSEDQTIHYCDVRCPCCSYFCKKQYGHFGSHSTSHGNMRNTYFLADAEEIDIEERKYKAGELGIAEMCNLYCSKMGREHVHYLNCEQGSKATCVYSGSTTDQRRHCTRALEPKPEKETDEVLHEQFWKTLGWEDPCTSKMELELFGKCGYKCDAPTTTTNLPWHKPELKPTSGFDGFTYVGGHKFECSHVASGGKMHHVFVLDCSGSMNGRPWCDLMAAWKEYVYNRIADGATLDLVSVVTFDNSAQIVYEAQNITTMTNARIQYRGGGTNYAAGLRSANEVLSRVNFDAYKPAIVFFSDGHPCDPLQGEQLATHIRGCYEKNGLQAFAVGFGSINLNMLERVAEKLGGSYHHVLTGNELKATFFSISASLNTRAGLALAKPDHERNCVICGQDLASGETVKLDGCGHELHKACFDVLVRNAQQDGEPARCPSCRREIST